MDQLSNINTEAGQYKTMATSCICDQNKECLSVLKAVKIKNA